ncbi:MULTISPECIES: hypothetical protein [unclassified Burkholderia]|uniref:hypothetical protein n=1 Tax=unclassified Burkholderia TaxID=2613784 RepID=UPI00163B158A|nr:MULTISPECIES: hypothetical protein [unclassified Burkholderia]
MGEWIVSIYAAEWHTSATWRFSVSADCKALAISTALWLFRCSAEYTDKFDRIEAVLM